MEKGIRATDIQQHFIETLEAAKHIHKDHNPLADLLVTNQQKGIRATNQQTTSQSFLWEKFQSK
jgi:hypothetical protein